MKKMFGLVLLLVASSAFAGPTCTKEDKAKWQDQKKFEEKYSFPFALLADEDKSVIEAFGVWGPKKFMGREFDGIHRTTFVIDENGIITDVIEKVKTKEHSNQIL